VETGQGRPDLEVCIPHRLVWIEVKVEAELRVGQLEGYRLLLNKSGVERTRLVLLSRYPEIYPPGTEQPDVEVRWFEVADWVESQLAALEAAGPVAAFLARQFVDFLRIRGMTLTQVNKFMPEGVRALGNMLNMLSEAAAGCRVSVRRSVAWDYIGFTLEGKYWVGLYFTEPEKLWFATSCRIDPEAAASLGSGEVTEENWVPGRSRWWQGVELDAEEVHFYSRSKVSQIEWLEAFLKDCLEKARSIETPDQPPIPEETEGH
jgi:hypothetical protein